MKILAIIESIGLGHAVRTLEVLREFKKSGYEIKAIANNSAASLLNKNHIPLFDIPLSINLAKKEGGFDVGRTVLENIKLSKIAALAKIREVLKKEKPNAILVDTSLVGVIAANTAKEKNTPLLFISSDNTYQTGIKDGLKGKRDLSIIDNFVQAAVDSYIVPDFPPPYTISEYNLVFQPKMNFVGPLSWALRQRISKAVKASSKKTRSILLTQGKSSFYSHKLISLLQGEVDIPEVNIPQECNYTESFIKSEIIIHHGGHTTAMDSILLGKPQIIIPMKGYSERENNGKKIEELQLGRMLNEKYLDKSSLKYAIEEVRQYNEHIIKFSRYARSYNAPKKIYDLLEAAYKK